MEVDQHSVLILVTKAAITYVYSKMVTVVIRPFSVLIIYPFMTFK